MSSDQPPASKPHKPGFFSRLFTSKKVEVTPEELEAGAPPGVEELPPLPSADSLEPIAEELLAEPEPEKRKSLFQRWFGKKEPVPAPEPIPVVAEAAKPTWFERLRDRLRKGTGNFVSAIRSAVGLSGKLDADTIERIEEILIAADVGMDTTLKIIERMKKRAAAERTEGTEPIMALFRDTIAEIFVGNVKTFDPVPTDGMPFVVMVVGVNGVGKTTTIGKMAKRCTDKGLKTMLVAGDTFRAAAIEQLEIWSERAGSDFVKSKPNSDPSGLVFDALTAAKARGIDVVFVDTAGRLHTKTSLMEELGKISRVMNKIIPGAPHQTLLVIDATTGQNAVNQVRTFQNSVNLSGLVMTKLDGTAKGGILISIRDQFNVPVTLIGVGEGVYDLQDFDPEMFAKALFAEEGYGKAAVTPR